jgi:hypothetical protein
MLSLLPTVITPVHFRLHCYILINNRWLYYEHMQPGEVLVWHSNTVYHAAFHTGDTPYTRESLDMRITVRTVPRTVLCTVLFLHTYMRICTACSSCACSYSHSCSSVRVCGLSNFALCAAVGMCTRGLYTCTRKFSQYKLHIDSDSTIEVDSSSAAYTAYMVYCAYTCSACDSSDQSHTLLLYNICFTALSPLYVHALRYRLSRCLQ